MITTDAARDARDAEHARRRALAPVDLIVEDVQREADTLVRSYVVSHRDGAFVVRTFLDGRAARYYWSGGARADGLEPVRVIDPANPAATSPIPAPSAATLRRRLTAAQLELLERYADGRVAYVKAWRSLQALLDRGLVEQVLETTERDGRRRVQMPRWVLTSAGLTAIGR